MTKISDEYRRDIFIVKPKLSTQDSGSLQSWPSTHTVTRLNDQRVHILDREVFDRAIKAAMHQDSAQNEK